MLTNFIVAIILQYIPLSEHHVVHPELTKMFMSIISQKPEQGKL